MAEGLIPLTEEELDRVADFCKGKGTWMDLAALRLIAELRALREAGRRLDKGSALMPAGEDGLAPHPTRVSVRSSDLRRLRDLLPLPAKERI